jgi:ubiquinone/menaquinone biosynthesis C-methylase UbiE
MDARDALELIEDAVPSEGGTWADFGAGEGVFTRALAERIGTQGVVYAVDRDASALASLRERVKARPSRVIPVHADFATDAWPPALDAPSFDGMLFANALHFVRDAAAVLTRLVARLRPGGRVVVVEYDRRAANPWVPFPIPRAGLDKIAADAGLTTPRVVATRPSEFGGDLYAAYSERPR